MLRARAKILSNQKLAAGCYRLTLFAPDIVRKAHPGQFVQVRVDCALEPLLRRPFSIHRAKGNRLEILYATVGQASKILSGRKAGEWLDIIGPLGRGFNLDCAGAAPLLVSGGMGVAPLVFLAQRLSGRKKKGLALLGAADKKGVLCQKDFQDLGFDVKIATDNGSLGFKGRVTGLLEKELARRGLIRKSAIYACGPQPMLEAVARLSRRHGVPAWVSLEEHMACGLGACLGCVVKTRSGYQRVCQEGPVFEANQILLD